MRLDPAQQQLICHTLQTFFKNCPIEIFLYGSRANDALLGGDIDLLVIVPDPVLYHEIKLKQHVVLAALKTGPTIGDQKIDVKYILPNQVTEPFCELILKNAVKLKLP